jgi:polysaccharide chain length determinant protein (PEP-CTERM system associated)
VIPGKHYKPEDFVEIAWRRRWFVLVPFVLIMAGTLIVTQLQPDLYRSSALLLIVPQRIPENLVRSTVTTRLDERLSAISQEILSRTRLENIVQEFDLYPNERRRMIMEDVIENMRSKDIIFSPPRSRGGDAGSFTISFEYTNPRTAMLVTERLASLFIRENIENRAVLADQTDQFLQSQLQEAERQLKDREKKLEAFRRTNPGLMPQQMEANQQALQNTQLQLQALQESMNHDRDRQIWVQRQLADLAMAAASVPAAVETGSPTPTPMTATRQLEIANANLKAMRLRYKPDHPDIKQAERTIAELERKAAAEALEQPVSPVSSGVSGADQARVSRLSDLQGEEQMLQRRIVERQEDERKLLAQMTVYRQRLEAAPGVESELTQLMRDYTTLQNSYQSLLGKSQDAKVSANLERRQIGEQFKIIDSPRMPLRPTSPNRLKYNLFGAFGALAVGLGLAALLEYRDSSLRTEDDIVTALSLPVLAMVPTMTTKVERLRRRRQRLLLASSGAVALLLCIGALAWKLPFLKQWMW